VIAYSEHVRGAGEKVFERLCAGGFEGMVSKRANGRYRSGRSDDWLKTKCMQYVSGSRTWAALMFSQSERHDGTRVARSSASHGSLGGRMQVMSASRAHPVSHHNGKCGQASSGLAAECLAIASSCLRLNSGR
jgi:hypothetical protein